MTDKDLLSLQKVLLGEADTYVQEEWAPMRAKALQYYDGLIDTDKIPNVQGRSQMVVTELRDTIEWILPDLVKIFTGGEDWISVEPQGEEDSFQADVAEDWVNYVVMRQNNGFINTYTWIKDALLQRNGFLVQDWKVEEIRERQDFKGLSEEEYQILKETGEYIDDDGNVLDGYAITDEKKTLVHFVHGLDGPEPMPGKPSEGAIQGEDGPITEMVWDVAGYRVVEDARICETVVPPEHVKVLSDTRSVPHDCEFIGIEQQVTVSKLREMFPDADIPDDISGPNLCINGTNDQESVARRHDTTILQDEENQLAFNDPTIRKVWLYRIWLKTDRDGDGIAEWNHSYRVGDTLLSDEEVDYPTVYSICPILWPHRFVGLSLSDLLFDLQELQTALNRQILDAVYLANNPRHELVIPGMTEETISAFLDNRIGGGIPVRQAGTIVPLMTAPLQPWTFQLLELWDQKREGRTGVSRYSAGLDPNSLNKTATGVMQIMSAASRRIELIARIFAETGFKDRVRGILDLSAKYPDYVGERVLRLTGKQINLSADQLRGRYDLIVNAGIGTGNKQEHAQQLLTLLQTQFELIKAGMGPGNPQSMVTMENLYNTLKAQIELMGRKAVGDYITDPNAKDAQRDPPKQSQPSPEELNFQLEQQKLKQDGDYKMADLQQKALEAARQYEIDKEQNALKARELDLKEREVDGSNWERGHRAGVGQ